MQARPPRRSLLASATLGLLGVASTVFGQSTTAQPRKVAAAQAQAPKATKQAPAAARAPEPEAAPLPAAGGEVRSWYLRNEVGGNFIPAIGLADRSVVDGPNTYSTNNATLSVDAGFSWTIAGGWRVTDILAIEVSSGLSYNEFSHVTGTVTENGTSVTGSLDVGGELIQVPVLAGARLELPIARDLWLNLGASAGGIYLGATLDSISGGGITVPLGGSDGAWAFAYSATLGLEWDLTADIGLGIAYRFLGTTSATFGPADLIGSQGIYNQNVLATVTLRF